MKSCKKKEMKMTNSYKILFCVFALIMTVHSKPEASTAAQQPEAPKENTKEAEKSDYVSMISSYIPAVNVQAFKDKIKDTKFNEVFDAEKIKAFLTEKKVKAGELTDQLIEEYLTKYEFKAKYDELVKQHEQCGTDSQNFTSQLTTLKMQMSEK